VSRPLSEEDEEDRTRIALGLTSDDPLPEVERETLLVAQRLTFPFTGEWSEGFLGSETYLVQVTGLLGPDEGDEVSGLLCLARRGMERVELPLAEIEVDEESPHRPWLESYAAWLLG